MVEPAASDLLISVGCNAWSAHRSTLSDCFYRAGHHLWFICYWFMEATSWLERWLWLISCMAQLSWHTITRTLHNTFIKPATLSPGSTVYMLLIVLPGTFWLKCNSIGSLFTGNLFLTMQEVLCCCTTLDCRGAVLHMVTFTQQKHPG